MAPFGPIWPHMTLFGLVWPHLGLFGSIQPYFAPLEGTPKDNLLGIDGRLKEGLKAKMELDPYQEEQCHGRIVHASKIEAFMESVRKI